MSVQTDSPLLVAMVEDSIRRGLANATLIEWAAPPRLFLEDETINYPQDSINAAIGHFQNSGWIWKGHQLEKDGWLIWFRSQGQLSPPIIQWSRISALPC